MEGVTIAVLLVFLLLFIKIKYSKTMTVFDKETHKSSTFVTPSVIYIQEKYRSGSIREVVNILDIRLIDSKYKDRNRDSESTKLFNDYNEFSTKEQQ